MKVLGRIDGSIYGAIRSHSSVSRAISSTTQSENGNEKRSITGLPTCQWHTLGCRKSRTDSKRIISIHTKTPSSSYSTITTPGRQRPFSPIYFNSSAPGLRNWNHTSSAVASPNLPIFAALPQPRRSREELLAFIDYYDDANVEDQLEFLKDPYMRKFARPEVPELIISDKPYNVMAPSPDDLQKGVRQEQDIIAQLRTAVSMKLRRAHSIDTDFIYDLYRAIPEPRMTYLPGQLRHTLLAALGATERRNSKSMLRYFAVVADVKNAGFSLTRREWNTALSFASRYVGYSTHTEAETALHLWREMEHDAGIKGNEVTFNILFDVASKAGKFALAEMIYQEMIFRKLPFNRYHHVSLIHFFGLKMDSSGVRAAYKELVEHGEVIDTVVLNCVIASFIRCGEESSADHVYAMMKASDERSSLIPHREYTFNKMVNKVLLMFGRVARKHPDLGPAFQSTAVVTPDLATYRIFLNYYGVRLGQMSKVAQFLDEMKFFRVPLHGSVFLALFKGFATHGGTPGTAWSVKRLRDVWAAFLDAFDSGADGLYIGTWMAMWVLRAFAKCTGSREEVLAVYEELRVRWPAEQGTDTFMLDFLHKLLLRNGLSADDLAALP
jgi:pentatricopeptide repeat protein